MGHLTTCGCIYSKLDVLHDGTIVPCHVLHQLSLGHIETDSFEDIWQFTERARKVVRNKEYKMYSDNIWGVT